MSKTKKHAGSAEKKAGQIISASKREVVAASFDIWPEANTSSSKTATASRAELKAEGETAAPAVAVLGPGLVLLKGFLSLSEQQQLVDQVRTDSMKHTGFTAPSLKGDKEVKLRMFCYGQQWTPRSRTYEATPGIAPMPQKLTDLCRSALRRIADSGLSDAKLPAMTPDHAICNFYTADIGNMRVHQDSDETADSIKAGLPVVSVSVGDAADFAFSSDAPAQPKQFLLSADKPMPSVRLESGDVLVFGGPARLIYHGVKCVYANTAPRALRMRPGRLNLTLRQNAVDFAALHSDS